eukprot:759579-Hanusia_phi.AAC.7
MGNEDRTRCERLLALQARMASLRDALGSELPGKPTRAQAPTRRPPADGAWRELYPSAATLRDAVVRYYEVKADAAMSLASLPVSDYLPGARG